MVVKLELYSGDSLGILSTLCQGSALLGFVQFVLPLYFIHYQSTTILG